VTGFSDECFVLHGVSGSLEELFRVTGEDFSARRIDRAREHADQGIGLAPKRVSDAVVVLGAARVAMRLALVPLGAVAELLGLWSGEAVVGIHNLLNVERSLDHLIWQAMPVGLR
jgi:hypothetical protein